MLAHCVSDVSGKQINPQSSEAQSVSLLLGDLRANESQLFQRKTRLETLGLFGSFSCREQTEKNL